MNTSITESIFDTNKIIYKSKIGSHYFAFKFVNKGGYFDIFCLNRPSLNGKSASPSKTHLYHSGKICFVSGREPNTISCAKKLTAQWAEYYSDYRITGKVQQ